MLDESNFKIRSPPFDFILPNWLLTSEAQTVLKDLAELKLTAALVSQLRKTLSVEQVSSVVEQVELRRRGRVKFGLANEMLFTRVGLEQATDEAIARYKSAKFLGATNVMDICSGVGGDLTGFASHGINAIGIDRNSVLADFASHNARLYLPASSSQPKGSTTLISTRSVEANGEVIREADAWHADPDRRVGGKRSTRPESHEPSLEELSAWREQVPNAAIKFAPAAKLSEVWQQECELEWISRGGECRQLVTWSGALANNPGLRRATRLPNDLLSEESSDSFTGEPNLPIDVAEQAHDFLYEPDASILAAHLTGALAAKWNISALTPGVAYLTNDEEIKDPLLSCFRIEEQLSFDRKKIAKYLAARSVGRLEIKCRSVDVNPAELRKQLKLKGDQEATLLIAPSRENRNKPQVFIGKRCLNS